MVVEPPTWKLWTALWTVYLVWGSTYLGIKVSVQTLPPLLSAGARFVAAAILLAGVVAVRGTAVRMTGREALSACAVGVALLGAGVGGVTLAETRIDSSVAAMIAGSVPLQIVLWRTAAKERVATATRAAAVGGLVGLGLIVLPGGIAGGSTAVGLAIMLAASICWSTGSFVSRRLSLPRDPVASTVLQMLAGGAVLLVAAVVAGEPGRVDVSAVSGASLAAWAYLVVAGSLVGFTAYAWLLRRAPISQVVTHQYVNPLVAIALGTVLLGEDLPLSTALGAAVVVGAVFLTVRAERPGAQGATAGAPAPASTSVDSPT
jgi:drug/metabolite transporter (DMT)-like permease